MRPAGKTDACASRRSASCPPAWPRHWWWKWPCALLELAAGRFNRAFGTLGGRNVLVLDAEGLADLARQDDLHALGAFGHQVSLEQAGQGDIRTLDAHQIAERQLRARRFQGGLEADLGQAALQRHLAAFETDLVIASLAPALTLPPAPA